MLQQGVHFECATRSAKFDEVTLLTELRRRRHG